jgi:hypothetical protein
MNCEELIKYLSDYIDRDLDEQLRVDAQEHLATCNNCQIILDTTQKTILLCRQATCLKIPAERRKVLFQNLQDAFSSRKDKTHV